MWASLCRVIRAAIAVTPFSLLLYSLTAAASWLDVDNSPQALSPTVDSVNIGIVVEYAGWGGNGPSELRGANLAAQEINAAGGINGHPLALIVRDSMGIAALGAAQVRQLVDQGVVAIAGIGFSSVVIAANPVVAASGTPLIGATSTSAAITLLDDHDTVYRVVPSDSNLGRALNEMIIRDGVKRLGIIARADSFNQGFVKSLQTLFPDAEAGRSIVSLVSYPEDKWVGFSAEVAQLFGPNDSNQLDGIALFGFADALNVTHDLASQAPRRPIHYYAHGIWSSEFIENGAREILIGMGDVSRTDNPDAIANFTDFQERYAAFYGIPLAAASDPKDVRYSAVSRYTYDSVYLLALAMAQAGENSREAILAHLRLVSGGSGSPKDAVTIKGGEYARALEIIATGGTIRYEGTVGPIRFDENGDVSVFGYQEIRIEEDATGQLVPAIKGVHAVGDP